MTKKAVVSQLHPHEKYERLIAAAKRLPGATLERQMCREPHVLRASRTVFAFAVSMIPGAKPGEQTRYGR